MTVRVEEPEAINEGSSQEEEEELEMLLLSRFEFVNKDLSAGDVDKGATCETHHD